uniref:Coiled-coil domain-containing protein 157 n=1 Tax=Knipowitschia caucasica TaxID=637954 RepID=A0AAV2MTH1_KNICA
MVALLDHYDFIHGEATFNQHSHIVLLELVIDRLLLLLQSFNVFVEQLSKSCKRNQTKEKGFLSLGLVVRNYWSNLLTYKVSYKKQTPLSLSVQDTVELGQMTATDIAQWGAEENRDLRRLAKHLQEVRGIVEPLKAKLVTVETEKNMLKSDMKRLRSELKEKVGNYQATTVQLEFSLQKAQRSVAETQKRGQEEQQKHQREILSLDDRNSSLAKKVAEQLEIIKTLEAENISFQEKIRLLLKENESCKLQLQNKTQKLQADISELQLCLHKEEAKYNSACRQQEATQGKQKSLVDQVNSLDEECEELQRQLGESEEKQIELHNQIQQLSEEREQLQVQLNQQQESCVKLEMDKETLRSKMSSLANTVAELEQQITACTERERLLVAFPDLYPLPQAQAQSTGNVTTDMEQQIKANCLRIHILEQENTTLQRSLLKVKERTQTNEPQNIWNDWRGAEECPTSAIQERLVPRGSDEALQRYRTNRKEAGGERDLKSVATEDRMSASSLSSVQLHFQTLQLRSSSAKTSEKSTLPFHSRPLKQRRK